MGCFGDGMPQENIPVRFPALSALVGENQEPSETSSKAVWSRETAQLGFSELPAKTETFSFLSELSCNVPRAVPMSTPCSQGRVCFLGSLGTFAAVEVQGQTLPAPSPQ